MSCIIGSVTLDHDPLWIDRHRYQDVDSQASVAIDGSDIVVSAERNMYPITLQSTRETGWLLGSTITSLRALSAVVGSYYTLTMPDSSTYKVRFRNEQSGGAIQMETLVPHSNPGASDWYFGTIYLMCVG